MKQLFFTLICILSFNAFSNYEEIDQEALPIDYEALKFNQDELRRVLNNEMDFIESRNDVKLEDEINVTSSAIERSPAINSADQEGIDDEELSTLFESETPKKERRIRSR
jgi:hypothetical protein